MKKILISGGSGAIGSVVASKLAAAGADIAVHYHQNKKRAEEIAEQIKAGGQQAMAVKADLGRPKEIKKMVSRVVDKLGGLEVFIHCASTFERTAFAKITEENFDDNLATNLKGAFFLAQEVAQVLPEGGRMIFFSDAAARRPYAGYLLYCIAKAGIETLVKGLAKKLAPKIAVNAIAPYLVTRLPEISDEKWAALLNKIPAKRTSSPEEIAELVEFLTKASSTLTGQILTVDGGRFL